MKTKSTDDRSPGSPTSIESWVLEAARELAMDSAHIPCIAQIIQKHAPTIRAAAMIELSQILKRARDRGCAEHPHEIKWLIELPMTDDEYNRFNEITGWSPDGQPNDQAQRPKVEPTIVSPFDL